jgi:hypothetical protein
MNLNHNTDADVLDRLSQVESKQGYIKDLIRRDINRNPDRLDGTNPTTEALAKW